MCAGKVEPKGMDFGVYKGNPLKFVTKIGQGKSCLASYKSVNKLDIKKTLKLNSKLDAKCLPKLDFLN